MTTELGPELLEAAHKLAPSIVADRRAIHANPELRYEEVETSKFVMTRLTEIGIGAHAIAGTGIVGLIKGARDGKTVLLRADMDALPITEVSSVDYRSRTDGRMHACGHDGHTAMLLAAARLLNERRDQFAGNVKLMFQPAEEGGGRGGALPMIDAGLLNDPKVDGAFALHVSSRLFAGQVGLRPGPVMAAADRFSIVVRGLGGHAARPNVAIDPVVVSAHIVTALQTILSRELSPTDIGVVTVAMIKGGEADNAIPDTASMYGTTRSFDPATRELLQRRVTEIATGVATALRATAEVEFVPGYPAVVNDAAQTARLWRVVDAVAGSDAAVENEMVAGAEDFSRVLELVPGSMFYLGVRNRTWVEEKPIHNAAFDLDEEALPIGSAVLAGAALSFLADN